MRKRNVWLAIFHAFISVGALGGGLAAIINPQAPLGMQADALKNFPFPDFFIPGLILFAIIGLGNLAPAILYLRGNAWADHGSGILGAALMVFITVQCFMLQAIVFLHVLYFSFGTFLAVRALVQIWRQQKFPFSILRLGRR